MGMYSKVGSTLQAAQCYITDVAEELRLSSALLQHLTST